MKKLIIITIILVINGIYCTAQNDVHPDIPEVSTLIKYIEEPVSYNRGRVNISIPLYTIEEDGISIPISISYYHGGLKPNERSAWIGNGWTLNAEPSIATTGRGVEYASPLNTTINRTGPDYYTNLAKGIYTTEEPSEYYYNLPNKSGAFYFNWMSDNTYKAVTLPFEPIKINWFKLPNTASGYFFDITDDQGIYYRFGESLSSGKYIVGDNGSINTLYKGTEIISASKKDTVFFEYYNADQDQFVSTDKYYQVEDNLTNYSGLSIPSRPYLATSHHMTSDLPNCSVMPSDFYIPYVSYNENGFIKTNYFYCENSLTDYCHIANMWQSESTGCRKDDNSGSPASFASPKIETIIFKGGKVVFNRSYSQNNTDTPLQSIVVSNNQNEIIRQIIFNNRVIGGNTQYPVLQSIQILDKNNQQVEQYQFAYNGDPNTNFTTGVNFWGYSLPYSSVGNNVNKSIIPVSFYHIGQSYYLPVQVGSMNREDLASQAGILTSITNSLGGTTSYEYESDSYIKQVIQNPIGPNYIYKDSVINAGGLRIKEIIHTDPSGNSLITRDFKYGKKRKDEFYNQDLLINDPNWKTSNQDEESGIGLLKRPITVNDYMLTQTKQYFWLFPNNGYLSSCGTTQLRTLSTWLFGDITYSGSPVLYDRVSEYITKTTVDQNTGDEVVTDNGKIVYDYQDFRNYTGTLQNGFYEDTKNEWKCGQLLSKQIYERTNNTPDPYSLISRTDYGYQPFEKEIVTVGKAILNNVATCNSTGYLTYGSQISAAESAIYSTYGIETGVMKVSTQTDSVFTPQGVVVTNKAFSYNNTDHLYPTSIITTNSDGKVHTQALAYPQDAGTLTDPDHLKAKSDLINDWIISPVLEDKETTQSSSKSTYNSYKTFDNGLPLLNKRLFQFNNSGQYEQMSFLNYNDAGKPLSILKNNADQVVYLWGYKGQYLIAEIKNAAYSDVETQLGGSTQVQSISDALIPDMTKVDALRSTLPNAQVTTYTYKPLGGMLSEKAPNGVVTTYVYDDFNRLKYTIDTYGKIIQENQYHYMNQ